MSSITIYHNPRCSKSRETLQLLQQNGVEPIVVEYLKTPPSEETLTEILSKLGLSAHQLMRVKETEYKELDIKNSQLNDAELIKLMTEHPKLIERPIVVNGDKAAIGRPPEQVLDII